MPTIDIGLSDLSKGWAWVSGLSPAWQTMIATGILALAIAVAMFFGLRQHFRGQLEAKDTKHKEAMSAHARLIAEKDATIERQQAEISTLEQRIRHRDEQLAKATGAAVATGQVAGTSVPHLPSKIGTLSELGAHHARAVRLWEQANQHRGQLDSAYEVARSDWSGYVDSRDPIRGAIARMSYPLSEPFPPKERMKSSVRQLQGVASDFRGILALLSQSLNFEVVDI